MVLLQVLTVYSIHLCEFWCVLLPVFPWQHFPFQTSRHANPVDFFMDLVTPEVSTAEVKLFVNHYGQGLGGWWPVENLDQPKVQHPWGFYVKWITLKRKSQPWHVVRKNNILSGDFLASEAREGGNDAIWWLHVFFWGVQPKTSKILRWKYPLLLDSLYSWRTVGLGGRRWNLVERLARNHVKPLLFTWKNTIFFKWKPKRISMCWFKYFLFSPGFLVAMIQFDYPP